MSFCVVLEFSLVFITPYINHDAVFRQYRFCFSGIFPTFFAHFCPPSGFSFLLFEIVSLVFPMMKAYW